MSEVIDLSSHTYEDALKLCELVYEDPNASAEIDRLMTEWGRDKTWEAVEQDWINSRVAASRGEGVYYGKSVGNGYVKPITSQAGTRIGYETTSQVSMTDALNSNSVTKATVRTPMQTTYEVVEQVPRTTFKTGVREAGTFIFGDLLPAVAGVSTGIALGKKISQTAYDHGLSWGADVADFDRTLYEGLTVLDPLDQAVFKTLWGLDEATGTTTAYLDEDALAYMAWYLADKGALDQKINEVDKTSLISQLQYPNRIPTTFNFTGSGICITHSPNWSNNSIITASAGYSLIVKYSFGSTYSQSFITVAKTPFTVTHQNGYDGRTYTYNSSPVTYNGQTFYYSSIGLGDGPNITIVGGNVPAQFFPSQNPSFWDLGKLMYDGDVTQIGGMEGVDDQSGATQPNATGWTSLPATKQGLQQQYPDMYNNAKHYDYTDENGNNRTKTYLPIPLPDTFSPTNPTSGDSTQDRTGNTILNIPKELIDTLTKIIENIPTPTTPTDGTPNNPPPTGSGGSPTVVMPVGSASSLWKIYNPTQAQIDSFGSWLWSSSFVEQIKKLFNDPMQAIIGVHKVFATPSIGGTATIKVGYLDSEVPSDWVNEQYVHINCGTVSLSEYFGNVFDYSPYTRVSLYLPFIGVVDLDVADVMRASIKVKYHVDVLSGACLADVIVSRDGCEAVLYQYSGSAIVTYPVSSGNYMGMVAGVLSVAGGLAGTIMSGGALAPALIGGAVGMSHLHTDVSHSGGFSGCAGAMGSKKPYLIISRPQTRMANNFSHFTGLPSNSHVTLNDCSGFTRVKSVYVKTTKKSTDEEKSMIEAKLKEGVLI